MRTRCSDCGNFIECEVAYTSDDRITLRGVEFSASQQHAFCPVCGAEVYPNPVVNYNVQHAHDAYRQAIGSVTAGEILGILERYEISARDLSILLGWEENTIERQLKHVIPSQEQADSLRLLGNPHNMRVLLEKGKNLISDNVWHKAMAAVEGYSYIQTISDASVRLSMLIRAAEIIQKNFYEGEYTSNYNNPELSSIGHHLAYAT